MKIIPPIPVTDAILVSSTVAEDDAPAYSAATTYAAGDKVISSHRVYESAQAANTGHSVLDPTWWTDIGPTKRWAPFDQAIGTYCTGASPIEIVLAPAQNTNAVALIDVSGIDTVRVRSTLQVSVARVNLCPDVDAWALGPGFALRSDAPWGLRAEAGALADGTHGAQSPDIPCSPGVTYTASADSMLFAASGIDYIDMLFYDANGVLLLDGAQNPLLASHDYLDGPARRNALSVQSTAPAGAATLRLRYIVEGATGITAAGVRMPKVEQGALPASDYTPYNATTVPLTTYDKTIDLRSTRLVSSWYDYFFTPIDIATQAIFDDLPIASTNQLTVTCTGAAPSLGVLAVGLQREFGDAQYGTSFGIIDYSQKQTDSFGVTSVQERAYAKRPQVQFTLPRPQFDAFSKLLASLRARPAIWRVTDTEEMLTIYGWVRDWAQTIAYPTLVTGDMTLEGLI